jgi:hypothetical protein
MIDTTLRNARLCGFFGLFFLDIGGMSCLKSAVKDVAHGLHVVANQLIVVPLCSIWMGAVRHRFRCLVISGEALFASLLGYV